MLGKMPSKERGDLCYSCQHPYVQRQQVQQMAEPYFSGHLSIYVVEFLV